MEKDYFNEIREQLCQQDPQIKPGRMMSSEAITYREKVFAFFSRKQKLVCKLGNDFEPALYHVDITIFNPFTKRPPLNGWFEIPYSKKELWVPMANQALEKLKSEL